VLQHNKHFAVFKIAERNEVRSAVVWGSVVVRARCWGLRGGGEAQWWWRGSMASARLGASAAVLHRARWWWRGSVLVLEVARLGGGGVDRLRRAVCGDDGFGWW